MAVPMHLATKLAPRILSLTALAALATLVSACVAGVGSPMASIPFDAAGRCAEYCSKMGFGLGAVVVMANNVGCVCTPVSHGGTASLAAVEGGAAGAGVVTLLAQEQQRQAAAAAAQHH
jgi:hypothetical protein